MQLPDFMASRVDTMTLVDEAKKNKNIRDSICFNTAFIFRKWCDVQVPNGALFHTSLKLQCILNEQEAQAHCDILRQWGARKGSNIQQITLFIEKKRILPEKLDGELVGRVHASNFREL